jgi:transcriptional regulator with XRE-family HTH domain
MVKNFCNIVTQLRIDKGLKQKDIALACDTTQETISRWEAGVQEPKISYLILLANFFNVSTDYLLGIEDECGRKIDK